LLVQCGLATSLKEESNARRDTDALTGQAAAAGSATAPRFGSPDDRSRGSGFDLGRLDEAWCGRIPCG
jgi:hypothetical protein